MEEKKQAKKIEKKNEKEKIDNEKEPKGKPAEAKKEVKTTEAVKDSCDDIKCPFHGKLKIRGRKFQGIVTKKFPKRIVIEFERTVFFRKYERYYKKKTRIHARLPDCLKNEINVGDYVQVQECRPLSKLIHHVVIKKIKSQNKGEKL